jgi:opacity protein-like surface antigen
MITDRSRRRCCASAGYTKARIRATVVNGTAKESASRSDGGWLAGGGAEHQVAQNASARLGCRYSKLSER